MWCEHHLFLCFISLFLIYKVWVTDFWLLPGWYVPTVSGWKYLKVSRNIVETREAANSSWHFTNRNFGKHPAQRTWIKMKAHRMYLSRLWMWTMSHKVLLLNQKILQTDWKFVFGFLFFKKYLWEEREASISQLSNASKICYWQTLHLCLLTCECLLLWIFASRIAPTLRSTHRTTVPVEQRVIPPPLGLSQTSASAPSADPKSCTPVSNSRATISGHFSQNSERVQPILNENIGVSGICSKGPGKLNPKPCSKRLEPGVF